MSNDAQRSVKWYVELLRDDGTWSRIAAVRTLDDAIDWLKSHPDGMARIVEIETFTRVYA